MYIYIYIWMIYGILIYFNRQYDDYDDWLVVWNMTFIFPYFSIYWQFHNPNWLSYFSEGLKPPTRQPVWIYIYIWIILSHFIVNPWVSAWLNITYIRIILSHFMFSTHGKTYHGLTSHIFVSKKSQVPIDLAPFWWMAFQRSCHMSIGHMCK